MIFNEEKFERELALFSKKELETISWLLCDLRSMSIVKRNGKYEGNELHTLSGQLMLRVIEERQRRMRDLRDEEERFML